MSFDGKSARRKGQRMTAGFETEKDMMFSVRSPAWAAEGSIEGEWHGKANMFDEYPGRDKAMRGAGHDFTITDEPAWDRQVFVGPNGPEERFVADPNFKKLVNDKNGKTLAYVKPGYEVIQPSVLYDLTEAILDQDDVMYETGGTLRDGEVLWTLARVNRPFYVTGDDSPIFPYVAGTTANDGKGSMKFQNIMTRIKCWNTWNQAQRESEKSGREFVFRHVKNVASRIEQERAKMVLAGATKQAEAFHELAEELVKVNFSDRSIEKFLTEFIPLDPAAVHSDKVIANVEAARTKVRSLFNGETLNADIRNTGYGALQVGMEYLDHVRTYKSRGTYLKRTILRPEPMKNQLVPLIHRLAEEDNKVLVTV